MSLSKRIEELCQAVSQEADGEKLISLVDELNRELEQVSEIRLKEGVLQSSEASKDTALQPSQSRERGGKSNAA